MALPKILRTREFHLSLLLASLIAALAFNVIAFSFDADFTRFLFGDGIDFDAPEAAAARAEATVYATQIEEESIVLLKNDDEALPMAGNKLNVFGYGSSDRGFIHQGGGSGKTSEYARTTFYNGLIAAGIELNPTLTSFYNSFVLNRYGDSTVPSLQFRNYELDPVFYPEHFFESARSYSPYAAIVFSRPATEKLDIPVVSYDRFGAVDDTRNTLSLTDNELFLLDHVASRFEKVIIILNSGNAMEVPFANDPDVDAIMNVGYPGNTGCEAIGKVLLGKINPSGRTVDTFVYDSASHPSYVNCGELGAKIFPNGARYVDYAENIYVGYRYFETLFAEHQGDEDFYRSIVAYPFGHGLSYTEFSWSLMETKFIRKDGASDVHSGFRASEDGTLRFTVWVENTGTREGMDVVELYATPPYFRGGIEKSAANLVGYAKTKSLAPGTGEWLSLDVPLRSLASYDAFDDNDNGFLGYELEEGHYTVSLRSSAHQNHPLRLGDPEFAFTLQDTIRYAEDEATGARVGNLFTSTHNPISGAASNIEEKLNPNALSIDGGHDQGIIYLSRADFAGTFPKKSSPRAATKAIVDTFGTTSPAEEEVPEMTFGTREVASIAAGIGKDYDDPIFDALVRSCDLSELTNLVQHAGFGTPALDSIQKPRCMDLDGPSGINTTILSSSPGNAASYPSPATLGQSWSKELCYGFGSSVAAEALALGINGWYAPGANIHRSPSSGRNFEHFSEDPFLAGTSASYVCLGARDGGLYAYVKHLAADENETGTNGQYHFLTEQALREIYAKPFEIAVKRGDAKAIMLSKNRIGSTRAAGSTALIEKLLRGEWGFRGAVITDYYVAGNVMDADECLRAGVDLILEGEKVSFDDGSSPTFAYHVARAARNVIYCYCHTMTCLQEAKRLPFDHLTGAKNDVRPIWKPILIAIDAVLFPCLAVYGVFIFKRLKPTPRSPAE